jgi:hypothetical protein
VGAVVTPPVALIMARHYFYNVAKCNIGAYYCDPDEFDQMESALSDILHSKGQMLTSNPEAPFPNFLYKGVWVVQRGAKFMVNAW